MKRKFIFIGYILISILLLVGCDLDNNKEAIVISDVYLSGENSGIQLNVEVDLELLNLSESDIIHYGIVVIKHEVEKISDITLETKDITLGGLNKTIDNIVPFMIIGINETDYSIPYSVRAYLKYNDENNAENIIYANSFSKVNLYELAKKDNSDYAKEVISIVEKKIPRVELTVDVTNSIVYPQSSFYQAVLTKSDNSVTITVTLNEGYSFKDNIELIVNQEEISIDNYTLSSNTLVYRF